MIRCPPQKLEGDWGHASERETQMYCGKDLLHVFTCFI